MAHFKDRFKKIRTDSQLTQSQIADKLEVSQSTIGAWETGDRFPSPEIMESIADFFNVDIDYLYGRTDIRKKVHLDEDGKAHYYMSEETADVADKIFHNKELRLLFDAAQDAKPEDLSTVHQMLLALKRKENGENY